MMISKKMGLSRLLPMLAIGGMFVFSGCDDSKDLYNPERIQEEAKEAFPVKNIDPNQTWETSAVCNASVSVNETAGETYTIKVYTANPYNTNGDAALLAKTTVENGKTVNLKFDIPAALQYVYVMKVNGEGYSSAKSTVVTNGKIEVSFGGANTVTRAAETRAVSSIVTFTTPDFEDKNIFPTKESIGQLGLSATNGQIGAAGNYLINSSVKSINNWSQNANMYVTEDVELSSLYIAGNSKIFILPGASLTLPQSYSLGQQGSVISIGTNATLNANDGQLQVSNATIYNLGTINAKEIEAATSGYIYNAGKIAVTDKANVANENSLLVNEGTMTAASFETQGSSSFYNSGEVTISGHSSLSSGNQKWENQGTFTTNTMDIKASSNQLLNACKLIVIDLFEISVGQADKQTNTFNLDGGSYVECGSLFLNNATIKMGGKAFFNVKGTATYEWNTTGFYAEKEDFALLKIGQAIPKDPGNGNAIGYHGKLYVACDNHFENGLSGSIPYIIWEGDAQITGANNADITIPSSECNPGYNSIPGDDGGDDNVQTYAYAFEDMMKDVGDYDFNDVVLYVTVPYEKDGKKFVDVTLKAAGASKQLAVLFNKQTIFGNVHEALGVPVGTIVNTGDATGTTKTETIEVGNNFSLTNDGDFYISDGKREIHIPNFTSGFNKGDVPYAIRIASSWKWPKERVLITEAYTDFGTWAQDATSEPNWYNNSEGGKVMN